MKYIFILALLFTIVAKSQQDSISNPTKLNMEAVYDRPFIVNNSTTSIGGYITANYFRDVEDGISEGNSFSMPRLTLFVNSNISANINFLTELEIEEGGKSIAIEFAALDFVLDQMLTLRGGILMNPIGSFNQNHDDPKWEFARRPVYATQLLPATFSSVGFGLYGKSNIDNWTFGYEVYLTNGFDEGIIDNEQSKTYLPAVKDNFDRFEESSNGRPMFTGKISVKNQYLGEVGLSTMLGEYNIYELDGLDVAEANNLVVFAIDYNNTIPVIDTKIIGEIAWINLEVPNTYISQYGEKQFGGYVDIVKPLGKFNFMTFKDIGTNIAFRVDYADWNVAKFIETGNNVGDEYFALTPGFSLRPDPNTVIRINYSYAWATDFLGNSPTEISSITIGISSYF
jgi:hypothetical protein